MNDSYIKRDRELRDQRVFVTALLYDIDGLKPSERAVLWQMRNTIDAEILANGRAALASLGEDA